MKKSFVNKCKNLLVNCINRLFDKKEDYLVNPQKDFSRTQKISFEDVMLFPMLTDKDTVPNEMVTYFDEKNLPNQSALSYRRDQVKTNAFVDLLHDFTNELPMNEKYKNMTLIAFDGSGINIPYNPKDDDSFCNAIEGRKGFNQLHLNTCHDILNDKVIDCVIQGYNSKNEQSAMCDMIRRLPEDINALITADRAYGTFNVIATVINNNRNLVIRVKSDFALNLFDQVKNYNNEESFDISDTFYVGRRRDKAALSIPNYHYLRPDRAYDYLPLGSKDIDKFSIRLVKFMLSSGEYEYLVTNLPKDEFSMDDLKEIYRLRWNIETSYKDLKYAAGMIHIHSIKKEYILQEIYAKLTFYNFCTAVWNELNSIAQKSNKKRKHKYKLERTYLFKNCMRYFKGIIKDLEKLVLKRIVPERPGRRFKRNVRSQHADTLNYR